MAPRKSSSRGRHNTVNQNGGFYPTSTVVSIWSHWAGPKLWSRFTLSHLPTPCQDHVHGVSSSWSRTSMVRAACAGTSHSIISSAGLKQLLKSFALSQLWNNLWITKLVLTPYFFADWAYRASPQLQLKSWRGRLGCVGRNLLHQLHHWRKHAV